MPQDVGLVCAGKQAVDPEFEFRRARNIYNGSGPGSDGSTNRGQANLIRSCSMRATWAMVASAVG